MAIEELSFFLQALAARDRVAANFSRHSGEQK
jgi:hypothetical protein